jgi:hypothetical protein
LITDSLITDSLITDSLIACFLTQTRGFASPPFDGFALIGIDWVNGIISDTRGFVKESKVRDSATFRRYPIVTQLEGFGGENGVNLA